MKIENYYSARTRLLSLFEDRNPCAEEMRASSRIASYFPLPKRTKTGQIVCVAKFSSDVDEFITVDYVKRLFMVFDVMLCEEETRIDYIIVLDFRDYTFQHFLKTTTMAKTFFDVVQNVLPATVKGIHFVNVHTFVDKVVDFFKMAMKPKLRERFLVHENIETFYENIGDRDILPSDLGGKEPLIAELNAQFQNKIESYKSWFEKEENVRSNEKLRPRNSNNSWLMGTEGSFKQLAID